MFAFSASSKHATINVSPRQAAGVGLGVAIGAGTCFAVYQTRNIWFSLSDTAIRFGRSCFTAGVISYDYKYGKKELMDSGKSSVEALHQLHVNSAKKLLKLFKTQGGVYVKAGQHMSSLYYLLPEEFCTILSELHNKASERPFEEIRSVLEYELGPDVLGLFDSFDAIPVAAASIAQVHKATYNGMPVAVKIQFPDIERLASGDVRTIDFINKFISWAFPEYQLGWLVREFDANLPLELDFTHEAHNSNRTRKLFLGDPRFCTPQIYHATKKVLVMEWIDGVHVDDVEGIKSMGIKPKEVANELNRIFSEQIFKHRFVHCDPHAGNVLIRKTCSERNPFQICLLDNGLYREYTEDFCHDYAQLWVSILNRDEDTLSACAKRMDVKEHRLFASILTARPWESTNNAILKRMEKNELEHIRQMAQVRAAAITQVLAQVPSPLLLLLKTNDLLRSLNLVLGVSPLAEFSYTLHACQDIIQEREARLSPGWKAAFIRWFDRCKLSFKLFMLEFLGAIGLVPLTF